MYRRAIRPLLAATTCFLLLSTGCDKVDEKKADDKQADAKADEKAPEPPADAGAEAGAAADAGAEAGAEVAAEAGAEAGEPAAEAGEDKPEEDKPEEDKPEEDKPDDKKAADKKPAETVAKIDGKPIFDAKCKSCHGADGKGDTTIGKKVEIPSLAGTKLSKAKVISTVVDGVADTKMKPYKDKLSKDEIDAVATYVKKL